MDALEEAADFFKKELKKTLCPVYFETNRKVRKFVSNTEKNDTYFATNPIWAGFCNLKRHSMEKYNLPKCFIFIDRTKWSIYTLVYVLFHEQGHFDRYLNKKSKLYLSKEEEYYADMFAFKKIIEIDKNPLISENLKHSLATAAISHIHCLCSLKTFHGAAARKIMKTVQHKILCKKAYRTQGEPYGN